MREFKRCATGSQREISYVVSHGERGKPAIFLHPGCFTNHTAWNYTALLFESLGNTVIVPDPFGHGNSTQARVASECSLELLVRDMEKVMDAEAVDEAVVAGHSMGAMIGQGFAASRPERVSALVLVSGSYNFRETFSICQPTPMLNLLAQGADLLFQLSPGFVQATASLKAKPGEYNPDYSSERFREMPSLAFYQDLTKHTYERLSSMYLVRRTVINTWDTRASAAHIKAPTFIVHGEADINVPKKAAFNLARMIPYAQEPFIIPRGGHLLPFQSPEIVTGAIQAAIATLPTQKPYAVPAVRELVAAPR